MIGDIPGTCTMYKKFNKLDLIKTKLKCLVDVS